MEQGPILDHARALQDARLRTRQPPPALCVPGLAGLPAVPLPPPAEALRLPLASAACISAATFSCVACKPHNPSASLQAFQ